MKYICLSLFPEMIEHGLRTSVIGKAIAQGLIELKTYDIREYTEDKHGRVDDYTYGGGAGMLIQAQPVYEAYCAALRENGRHPRTIYVTPQGRRFDQKFAGELAKEEEIVFLCGHYEGIDERVLDEIVTDRVSVGDYVLTGGELAVMVMIDAVSRLVPGVLGNETSADTETFYNDLLEYPQYTRPEVWHGARVPEVLLCGNRAEIAQWRLQKSIERTRQTRPDLLEKYQAKQDLIRRLSKEKRNYIPMIESLRRGYGEIIAEDESNVILYDDESGVCMLKLGEKDNISGVFEKIPAKASIIMSNKLENAGNLSNLISPIWRARVACYTEKVPAKVRYKDIRQEREHCYSLYLDGEMRGSIRELQDGSMDMPRLSAAWEGTPEADAYEKMEIRRSLLAFLINRQRQQGFLPYAFLGEDDAASMELIREMGMYLSDQVWQICHVDGG